MQVFYYRYFNARCTRLIYYPIKYTKLIVYPACPSLDRGICISRSHFYIDTLLLFLTC